MADDRPSGGTSRPSQTAVDYVTIVLSPVLIMGLVGSLAFFLLEVFYTSGGPWLERLQWTLFFYVFGAVLVARISMHPEVNARAPLYGSILALLTLAAMGRFIEFPSELAGVGWLINVFLVGLIWWCTHRLTWDCTNVDEETDMSGEGLLQAAGLEEPQVENHQRPVEDEPEVLEVEAGGAHGWWKRYRRYRERRQKKRTLGVWVVYFSLAALPIFGLGQAFIPLTAPDRRRFAFWLMTLYVACGLGLLLTTCFLGLRRYLRQKRLQMPAAMTGAWLTMGATLLVGLLVLGTLLPRPHAEYALADLVRRAGSAKRDANRMAVKGGSPGEGRGQPGEARPDGKGERGPTSEKGKDSGQKQDRASKGSAQSDSGQNQSKSNDQKSRNGQNRTQGEQKGGQQQDRAGGEQKGTQARNQAETRGTRETEQSRSSHSPSSSQGSGRLQQVVQRLGPILKWIVFAVLAVVVLLALLRGGLGFLANFTDWARRLLEAWRNFWANLFATARSAEQEEDEDDAAVEEAERTLPFRAFSNPFSSERSRHRSPAALVRYSFHALEAWARERDLGRQPGETALEFIERIVAEVPALETEARRLGQLHARAEYARGGLPANSLEHLQAFWDRLERVAAMPLSA